MRLGDLPAAERAMLAALAEAPEDGGLLATYADVLMQAGQWDKAQRVLDRARTVDPDASTVLESAVTLAYLRHRDRRGRALCKELLAIDPECARAHQMLGELDWDRGDTVRASQGFAEAVRADPTDERTAAAARTTGWLGHPLYWPTRVARRFGAGPFWLAALAVLAALQATAPTIVVVIAAVAWLLISSSTVIAALVVD